jgi:hypothetical protein
MVIGYMGERTFTQHKIPKEFVTNLLFKIYRGTLMSIQNNDEEFLREYLEEEFANKLWATMQNMQKNNYKVSLSWIRSMTFDRYNSTMTLLVLEELQS